MIQLESLVFFVSELFPSVSFRDDQLLSYCQLIFMVGIVSGKSYVVDRINY